MNNKIIQINQNNQNNNFKMPKLMKKSNIFKNKYKDNYN